MYWQLHFLVATLPISFVNDVFSRIMDELQKQGLAPAPKPNESNGSIDEIRHLPPFRVGWTLAGCRIRGCMVVGSKILSHAPLLATALSGGIILGQSGKQITRSMSEYGTPGNTDAKSIKSRRRSFDTSDLKSPAALRQNQ